jgi:hypothetical protein
VEFRPFRFQEFDGQRLSVRVAHREREKLRALSTAMGVTESEVVREALTVYCSVMAEELNHARVPGSLTGPQRGAGSQ